MKKFSEMSLVEKVTYQARKAGIGEPVSAAELLAVEGKVAETKVEAKVEAKADAKVEAKVEAKAETSTPSPDVAALQNQITQLQAIVTHSAYADVVPGRAAPVAESGTVSVNATGGADAVNQFVAMSSREKTAYLADDKNVRALNAAIVASPHRTRDMAGNATIPAVKLSAAIAAQTGTPTFDLTGLGFAVISRKTLRQFGAALNPVTAFTTDFSDEVVAGASVTTRIFPLGNGAKEVNVATGSGGLGGNISAAAVDTTPTAVTVYLDGSTDNNSTFPADGFGITVADLQLIAAGVWPSVALQGMAIKTYNVAKAILKNVLARLTAANFSAIPGINAIDPANVDSDLLASIGGILKPLGFQPGMMSLLLGSPAHTGLIKDPTIKTSYNLAVNSLQPGQVPEIMGFKIQEAATLPFDGSTPATEKLIGFACMPGAVAIAARPIVVDAATIARDFLYFETMVEPVTGFPVTVACQWDRTRWGYNWIVLTRAGSAKADALQGYRLVKP